MDVLLGVLLSLVALAVLAKLVGENVPRRRIHGYHKCQFWGARLPKQKIGYATVCPACGREQPWTIPPPM